MRRMGGLEKYLPVTFATFLVGTLAMAGIPPFAGFFTKDEILWRVRQHQAALAARGLDRGDHGVLHVPPDR